MKMRKMRTLVVVPVVVILALTFLAAQLSAQTGAVVPEIGFEIEGDAALNHEQEGGLYDWENVEFPPGVLIADPNSKAATDSTTFKPDSKFDYPEKWSIESGQVGPGQNELTNILAWGILPGDLGDDGPADYWLVLGMERTKQEGTFDLDFEFNQVAWDGTSGGPVRTPGDLAVGFELKGNPIDKQTDLQVLIIQYLPGAQPSLCQVTPGVGNVPALVEVGTEPCPPYGDTGWFYRFLADGTIFSDSGLGQATMNEQPISVPPLGDPPLWLSTDSQGNPRSEIGPFQFAEAAINLTDLGVEASCRTYSTVHAKSRSSLEVTSDLKDLAGPVPLNVNCRLDGHKFLDVNGNGLWDQPGEPPLEGWEIALNDGSVTHTDVDGYYEFEDLDDGVHMVSEVCPDAWVQTMPGFTDFDTCGTFTHTAELDLYHREVNNLDFGNGQPELSLTKVCPADVFAGDDIEYEITVTNTGNVFLQDVLVEDVVLGLAETVDLAPGASETFNILYNQGSVGGGGARGPYRVFLPLVVRGLGSDPAQLQPRQDVIANTATATSQYALATVSDTDSCVTTVHKLTVRKDARTSFTRTYNWTIDKMVDDPGPILLIPGAVATPHYTVTVDLGDPPYVDGDWAVEGTIIIENPAPMDATLASVIDTVSPDITATVDCPVLIVPAGGSLTCTYGPVPLPDASSRMNMATATLINNNGRTTGFSATANVDFSQADIELIDEEVQVFDSFWDLPPELLGTVRYDEVPVTFTYSRTIQATGTICEVFEVPNVSALVTNDSGTTIPDEANTRVQLLELCTVAAAYEDLPTGAPELDWDYNDWVVTIDLQAQFSDPSSSSGVLRLDFAVGPEARGAAYDHVFHLRIPAGTLPCNGTSTLTLFDGAGNMLLQDVKPFDGSVSNDFAVIPWTPDALPAMSNTNEGMPYVPTGRTALLSLGFPDPCPFDRGEFDPGTSVHGEGLFFEPYLHVAVTGEDVGAGDSRTLIIPARWTWPEERIGIWLAYPDVVEGNPPTFGPLWWRNSTDLVYDGKP